MQLQKETTGQCVLWMLTPRWHQLREMSLPQICAGVPLQLLHTADTIAPEHDFSCLL